jgi:hypothetical protein
MSSVKKLYTFVRSDTLLRIGLQHSAQSHGHGPAEHASDKVTHAEHASDKVTRAQHASDKVTRAEFTRAE